MRAVRSWCISYGCLAGWKLSPVADWLLLGRLFSSPYSICDWFKPPTFSHLTMSSLTSLKLWPLKIGDRKLCSSKIHIPHVGHYPIASIKFLRLGRDFLIIMASSSLESKVNFVSFFLVFYSFKIFLVILCVFKSLYLQIEEPTLFLFPNVDGCPT
jgi:hypothetical protein